MPVIIGASFSFGTLLELLFYTRTTSSLKEQLFLVSYAEKNPNKFNIWETLAANLSLHPKVQFALFAKKVDLVNRSLAQNPGLVCKLQDALASDSNYLTRSCLAANSSLSLKAQKILSLDESALVRRTLAANPGVDFSVLVFLMQDESEIVRAMVSLSVSPQVSFPAFFLKENFFPFFAEKVALLPEESRYVAEFLSACWFSSLDSLLQACMAL